MSSLRPGTRNPSQLSIRPPSPNAVAGPSISTPTGQIIPPLSSPRRAPLPPSPTHSVTSTAWPTSPYLGAVNLSDDKARSNSLDVPSGSRDKRLPVPQWISGPSSPHKPRGASAYDNRLMSSTLSHLPPLPSPTVGSLHHHHTPPPTLLHARSQSPRPSLAPSSSSGIVVLPDGTALSHDVNNSPEISNRSVADALAHSSPSSPWSVLTVHALPLFAGGPLRTPIEDLNHLCHTHIIATSQRTTASRIVASLTADLREFIASGMLTLKAKFETLEEQKIIPRASEVWSFFWAQVLPYLEGVFLPFTQVRDLPSTSQPHSSVQFPPIPVRHLLLSGFMLHILLPLLPRLIPLITNPENQISPSTSDLQRILQMSLVLSTQARYSSIFPTQERRDEEVRENVEALGKAVRWRMAFEDEASGKQIQRVQSISQRRRKGMRGSMMPRDLSLNEQDDDDLTPNQSYAVLQANEWQGNSTLVA